MPYLIVGIIVVVILLFVLFAASRGPYYKKIFSEPHYAEIHDWLVKALEIGAIPEPSTENGSSVVTSAGIAIALTRDCGQGAEQIHISISEARGTTTHAVANRVGFLLFVSLNQNKCDAGLFYTESRVHHLVFENSEATWKIRPKAEAIAAMADYQQLPFVFQPIRKL